MSEFKKWEDYFWDNDQYGALRNKLDIRSTPLLREIEYELVRIRRKELEANPALVGRSFGPEHLQQIHAFLFQDVYEWAGQYRAVNMVKGNTSFAPVGEIDKYLLQAQRLVEVTDWKTCSREEFCTQIGQVFALVNYAHPFREGNGRASKVFLEHVAARSPYRLDFAQVSPLQWNVMSALLVSVVEGHKSNLQHAVEVITLAVKDREAVPVTARDVGEKLGQMVGQRLACNGKDTPGRSQGSGPLGRPGSGR